MLVPSGTSEGEIIDRIVSEIINDDKDFVEWLKTRRYKKKIESLIFQENMGVEATDEEIDKTGTEYKKRKRINRTLAFFFVYLHVNTCYIFKVNYSFAPQK